MTRPESLALRDELPGIERSDWAPYEPPEGDDLADDDHAQPPATGDDEEVIF